MTISTFKLCRDPGLNKASTGTIPGVFLQFYNFLTAQLGSHPEISYPGKLEINDGLMVEIWAWVFTIQGVWNNLTLP